MSTKIKGAEYPLSKIFSSDFDYEIPSFQRPYAWTEEEAGDLFDDLYDFYVNEAEDEQYFLGSIVLVKEDDKPHSEVIDGQQRLTTLTILLAAITSRLSGEDRNDFKIILLSRVELLRGWLQSRECIFVSVTMTFSENISRAWILRICLRLMQKPRTQKLKPISSKTQSC